MSATRKPNLPTMRRAMLIRRRRCSTTRLCENAQEPTRRRIVFSIALLPTAATALFVSTLTKSRRTFYAQIECVCFHTAWTLKTPRQRMTGAVGGGHSVGRGGRWQSAGLPALSPLDLPRDRAFQSAHCEAWIGLRTVFVNQQIGRAPSLLSRHQRVVRPELPDGRASQIDLSGVLM